MKKLIIIFAVCILFNTSSYAQTFYPKDAFIAGYEVGIPGSEFLSATSWYGFRFGYQRLIKPNLSVGLGTSWNSFSEYVPKTTYQKPDGSGALTSDIVKELYAVPITLDVRYYFKTAQKIMPYAGLGLGAQYSDQTLYFNIYSIEDNNWGFVMRPELGLIYAFNKNNAMYLSGTYNYATNKSDAFSTDKLTHVAVSLGFIFSN